MWQSFFLAIGITLCILGGECLVIDKAVLATPATSVSSGGFGRPSSVIERPRELTPPEWAPWSLLSAGMVVVLYSVTIPRRGGGE